MNTTICKLTTICIFAGTLAYAGTEFDTSLNLGLTLTEGNSETIHGNAAIVSRGILTPATRLRLALEASYGDSKIDGQTQTTVENIRGSAGLQHDISKRWYAALNTAGLYDDIAEIDYRVILGPAIGGYLIRRDNLNLTAEVGPSYIWERVSKDSDDYLAVRISERLEYQLSETAEIWQSAEYLPKADDFEDFLLNAEVGISAAMTTRVQLRMVLQLAHDSTPGSDLEKNDFTLISGLGIQL